MVNCSLGFVMIVFLATPSFFFPKGLFFENSNHLFLWDLLFDEIEGIFPN
jgi:hypothetical protein